MRRQVTFFSCKKKTSETWKTDQHSRGCCIQVYCNCWKKSKYSLFVVTLKIKDEFLLKNWQIFSLSSTFQPAERAATTSVCHSGWKARVCAPTTARINVATCIMMFYKSCCETRHWAGNNSKTGLGRLPTFGSSVKRGERASSHFSLDTSTSSLFILVTQRACRPRLP